jgi:DNA-binding NtrC family response regulator
VSAGVDEAQLPSKGLVLIGEDDRDLRDIIASFLEAKGWRVVATTVGPQTLARLGLEPFRVAVLDVRSLTSIGFRMLEELRVIDPALPVIVIASFGDVFVSRSARSMGASHVLEKPFDLEELEQALETLNLGA